MRQRRPFTAVRGERRSLAPTTPWLPLRGFVVLGRRIIGVGF